MIDTILTVLDWIFWILSLLLMIYVVLGYFLAPYNPIRRFLESIFNPLLKPFRKIIPPVGGFDLSPIALMLTFWLLNRIIRLIVDLIR